MVTDMATLGNDGFEIHSPLMSDDITLGELLAALEDRMSDRLTFRYDGQLIRSGYHVTEVKAGQFAALDCGANPEAWTELFVQLWDVDDSARQMTAGKFNAIIRKVADQVALDGNAKLTFEVSDGVRPMQLHRAAALTVAHGEVVVELSPRPASCKPRDRWLEAQQPSACYGSNRAVAKPCCN